MSGVSIAVVGPIAVSGGYIQFRRAGGDLQCAKILVQYVVALDGRTVPYERIGVGTAADNRLAAGHREGRRLLVAACRGDKTADAACGCQRSAVIILAGRAGGDGQGGRSHNQGALVLRLAAVLVTVLHRPAESVGHNALCHMGNGRRDGWCNRHHIAGGEGGRAGGGRCGDGHGITLRAVGHRVFILGVGIAVVGPAAGGGGYIQLRRAGSDLQCAFVLGNSIVGCSGVIVQRIAEGVGA